MASGPNDVARKIKRNKNRRRGKDGILGLDLGLGQQGTGIVIVASSVVVGLYLALVPAPPQKATVPRTHHEPKVAEGSPMLCPVEVVNRFPHDSEAFTQGLLVHNGRMFESTGLYKKSVIREVDVTTGEPIKNVALDDKYFGEGIAVATASGNEDGEEEQTKATLYQLTWRENKILAYDLDTLEQTGEFPLEGEGWGFTATEPGQPFILSNGSSVLTFLDPNSMAPIGYVNTFFVDPREGKQWQVSRINELEYIDGRLYANVWGSDKILLIDFDTGRVTHMLDLSMLPEVKRGEEKEPDDVLNGIAYDKATKQLYITGKRWPSLYQMELPDLSTCILPQTAANRAA